MTLSVHMPWESNVDLTLRTCANGCSTRTLQGQYHQFPTYNSICFVGAGVRRADDIIINGFENHTNCLSHFIPLHGVRSEQDLCGILFNIASFPRTIMFAFVLVHF